MKNKRKGISMVSLVVIITVMIILTRAIVIAVITNSPTTKANEVVYKKNLQTLSESLQIYLLDCQVKSEQFDKEKLYIDKDSNPSLAEVFTNITEEYEESIIIENGILKVKDTAGYMEVKWAEELGIEIYKTGSIIKILKLT